MAVTVDTVSGQVRWSFAATGANATATHNVSASATAVFLFIEIGLQGLSDASIALTTVSLGGSNFTHLGSALKHAGADGNTGGFVDVYYMTAASLGSALPSGSSTLSITETYTGGGSVCLGMAWSVSVLDGDGGTPTLVTPVNGTSVSSLTLTETLGAADMMLGICANGAATPGITTGTSVANATGTVNTACDNARVMTNTGSGSTTLVWSTNSADQSCATGVHVVGAGGVATWAGGVGTLALSGRSGYWVTAAPYVIEPQAAAISASRSPSLTFTEQPKANDVVIMWPSTTTTAITLTIPGGWENPLGGTTDVESDAHEICCVAHLVTAGEESGLTKTYTATNLFGANASGNVVGCIVRGVDPADIFAGANSTFSSSNATPHVLATVTPDATGGRVFSGVAKDGTGNYTTQPSGWTFLITSNSSQGKALLQFATLATSGTPTGATNITPSAGDEYASITVVLKKAPTTSTWTGGVGTITLSGTSVGFRGLSWAGALGTLALSGTNGAFTPHRWTGAVGTLTLSGTSGTFNQPTTVPYPASVSNRKWLDQNGHVFLYKGMSAWAMAQNLNDSNIETALDGLHALGFNAVLIAMGGMDQGFGSWDRHTNQAGQNFWSGTPWNSSLGAGWDSIDHVVEQCDERGMIAVLSLFVGYQATGGRADLEAVTSAQVRTAAGVIATRYTGFTNIVWHMESDDDWAFGTTIASRVDAFFQGIQDVEGTTRLVICEPELPASPPGTSWTKYGNAFTYFHPNANCLYDYGNNAVEQFDTVWNQSGATTLPVWDSEPPYVEAPHYEGTRSQQLRERNYVTFIRGGIGINFGHESFWDFDYGNTYSTMTWTQALADGETLEAGYCWTLVDLLCADTTWAPDGGTFLTTGLGSGDTKAASGFSNTQAAVYFPTSRTVAVDTTVLSGSGNVRLRWYDPTAGTFSTIAASEAQQSGRSVTYNGGTHADGAADWILVVDLVGGNDVTGTVARTLDSTTCVATGTNTVPPITGTTARTLDATTCVASGTTTVPAFTGTVARSLDSTTCVAAGSRTIPDFTGTVARTLDPTTCVAAGSRTVPDFTGTVARTLDATTCVASGSRTIPPVTGTVARTLDSTTCVASGSRTVPDFTGTVARTLDPATAVASGTNTVPPITGTVARTLDATTCVATGVAAGAGVVAGTVARTLDSTTCVASGTRTIPPVTGTVDRTLDSTTCVASGTRTIPPVTGTVSRSLDNSTCVASGTNTIPPITGTVAVTLGSTTCVAAGTTTVPVFTGTVVATLDPTTCVAAGSRTIPPVTGTATIQLANAICVATGIAEGGLTAACSTIVWQGPQSHLEWNSTIADLEPNVTETELVWGCP